MSLPASPFSFSVSSLFKSAPFQGSFGPNAPTTQWVLPIVAVIVGIALIIMVIYVIIQVVAKRPALTVMGPLDLYKPKSVAVIDREKTKSSMTGTYTLSFFVRIDAVPDMRSDATPLLAWPGSWDLNYNPAQEELVWVVKQSPVGRSSSSERVALKGVPLQRWTQVTLGFEGRSMDMYINGDLVRSYSLANVPPYVTSSITIVPGGIMGALAYVQLWPRRLTVSEVAANYIDTADSVGRPYLGPEFVTALTNVKLPNLFMPNGNGTPACGPDDENCATPQASASQMWDFPYA
jgi:hypothetical protein